nr:hypothetical protein [Tanacetum cinerariifolium]
MNEINMKAMQTQINNVKNELRNEMKNSVQASMSNQTNELKNMMASFFQMNTASTSGSRPFPNNTIVNPKCELKSITTRSGIVLDGPSVPMPPPFINPNEDVRVDDTLTNQDLAEYTIKVPPLLVQKAKPPSQRNYVVHQRDPLYPNIPYLLRMHNQPQGYNRGNNFNQDSSYQALIQQNQVVPLSELDKIKKMNEINMKAMQTQINNVKNELRNEMKNSVQASMSNQTNELKNMMASFFQMNTASTICLKFDLPVQPRWENDPGRFGAAPELLTKILKALLSNKEKLLELANTPLNKNCSAIILKKLPKKLRDPGKFIILCGFSELKCKALADLGASINLMPLSVWKKLGLLELISTRMTLKLANRVICTPAGITRDVFVSVEKFTFPTDFVIVDYESDLRVPLIVRRPFLRTARALIDVLMEKRRFFVTDYLEDLFATNHQSGNPTFFSHTNLTSSEVKDDIFDPEGDNVLNEKLLSLDSTKDLLPSHNINPLSGSTTSSSSPNHLLEEFADELALITFPSRNNDLPFDIESDLREIEYLLNHDPIKEMDYILEDSVDEKNLADHNLVDTIPEMFTDEHALNYSSPPLYDEYDDDLVELESDNDNAYNDPFVSKGEKIKRV